MKIKKYTATTMKQALVNVKQELGDEAVILNSRKVQSDEFPGQELFEVTAAVDEMDQPTVRRPVKPTPQQRYTPPVQERYQAPAPQPQPPIDADKWKNVASLNELTSDMHEIKSTVRHLTEQIKYHNLPQLPQPLSKLLMSLLNSGFNNQLAQELISQISSEIRGNEINDTDYLTEVMHNKIARKILTKPAAHSIDGSPYIIALVGPTGVGKTTTIAKMATHPEIYGRDRVAFVSSDTYRIAAIEQLRTFANIARIPMEVTYGFDEINRALLRHYDKDIILIDTPGRSPYNHQHMMEMKEFIKRAKPDEIHLVLSVTTRFEDVSNIIQNYNTLRINRFLFTKVDETQNPAMIINVVNQFQKPISFITNGQEVPNDIKPVTPNYLTTLILKEN